MYDFFVLSSRSIIKGFVYFSLLTFRKEYIGLGQLQLDFDCVFLLGTANHFESSLISYQSFGHFPVLKYLPARKKAGQIRKQIFRCCSWCVEKSNSTCLLKCLKSSICESKFYVSKESSLDYHCKLYTCPPFEDLECMLAY